MLTKTSKIRKPSGISNFRKDLALYIKKAQREPVIVSTTGGGSRVLLDVDLYNMLVEAYEDHKDSKALSKAIANDNGTRYSLGDIKKRYGISD